MQFITYLTTSGPTKAQAELFWYNLSGCRDGYQGQPWYYAGVVTEYDVYESAEEAIEADSLN
jgi:hypothetical protein